MSFPRCSAVIPLDNQNGIECLGPSSVMTEEGPRCAECFVLYGGTLVNESDQPPANLGLAMAAVIDSLAA
jgi:hypothetical protein